MTADGKKRQVGLENATRRWGTPSTMDAKGRAYTRDGGEKGRERPALSGQAQAWPTPLSRDGRSGATPNSKEALYGTRGAPLTDAVYRFSPPGRTAPNGTASSTPRRVLNPLFTEWLMGWPAGWTDASTPIFDPERIGCVSPETAFSRWLQRSRTALSTLALRELATLL